jgi:hypothetical protein
VKKTETYAMNKDTKRLSVPFCAVAVLVAVSFFSGCTIIPSARHEPSVGRLIDVINTGDVDAVMEYSREPFVFDQELLVMESEIRILWERLFDAGFALPDAEVLEILPVEDETFSLFARSFEMEVYFDTYLLEEASVARVVSGETEFLLLLGGRKSWRPILHGIKGPLS